MAVRWSTVSTIGAFTSLNSTSGDTFRLIPERCTLGKSLRTTTEDAPGADGILWFPSRGGQQVMTVTGLYVIRSASTESGYFSALDTIEASLESALSTLQSATGAFTFTGGSYSVALFNPYEPSWTEGQRYGTFGLVVTA